MAYRETSDLVHPPCVYIVSSMTYVVWMIAFITWGIFAISQDWNVNKNEACGKATHIIKYTVLNVVFALVVLISYLLFPGGGEGARARAIVVLTIHFAFAVWGALMWQAIDDACNTSLSDIFGAIVLFQHICIGHNCLFSALFLLHESFLGHYLHCDFTLLPEKSPAIPAPKPQSYLPVNSTQSAYNVPQPIMGTFDSGIGPNLKDGVLADYSTEVLTQAASSGSGSGSGSGSLPDSPLPPPISAVANKPKPRSDSFPTRG